MKTLIKQIDKAQGCNLLYLKFPISSQQTLYNKPKFLQCFLAVDDMKYKKMVSKVNGGEEINALDFEIKDVIMTLESDENYEVNIDGAKKFFETHSLSEIHMRDNVSIASVVK